MMVHSLMVWVSEPFSLLVLIPTDGGKSSLADEGALTVLALSCFKEDEDARCAMKRAADHLQLMRNLDGSYGSGAYSTALVMQVSGIFDGIQWRQRIHWQKA